MKIYFFNQETGVFQGEGFEDEKNLATLDGATTVAPPCYSHGEVPCLMKRPGAGLSAE